TVTLHGSNFSQLANTNAFWFGAQAAATWSVSTDGTTATVTVPATAYSAPFTLQQPGGVVQTVSPFYTLHGTVGTLAGNGANVDHDGTGVYAEFSYLWGWAPDGHGNLLISEYPGNRIRRLSPSGEVTTYGGDGTGANVDGPLASAEFWGPVGLAADTAGDVFVAEYNGTDERIRKISPAGVVSTVAGTGVGYVDGASSSAEFDTPQDICLDPQGNLYVADYRNNVIRKISSVGWVSTYAGSTSGTPGSTNGATSSALFDGPTGLALDAAGNLYVADRWNNEIREISAAGMVSTLAGGGAAADVDGIGTNAEINGPLTMRLDGSGNLYVGTLGNEVRKVSTSTGAVTTVAGNGVHALVDGATSSASFMNPGVGYIDASGDLYVGDGTYRVRVITP
ncbi:MAG: hypothetical protein KGR26_06545, partial [Cyanobacteria bacterium REEB65]|nr:hypothetical protein [Cyanobacteria bacterium REEB65]